jgi:DNA polymerase I-like protein with 3'-5' exonuclease and polymerase domains
MGAGVLVETMGEDKIAEAARILKLPRLWTYKQIAEHLLAQFHKTYPAISKIYYPGVIHEVTTTKMLTSKAVHDVPYQASKQGLVRYCFSDPSKSKTALNAYVAHPPQSLNAMTLNKAFMKVFYDIALKYPSDFKLIAQIHDSILFQFREGREELADKVKECMEIPVTIRGYDGTTRTFTVPAALKAGTDGNGSTNWGDTE